MRAEEEGAPSQGGLQVYYPQVYKLREEQLKSGVLTRDELSDLQMGLVHLEKCHHVSTASGSMKDGVGSSFRVRICKTCCQGSGHIELGTYVDQESAILVNDVHEIIKHRYDKLTLLRQEDEPYLEKLTARRYDRNRGKDVCSILHILTEKQLHQEYDKRSRSSSMHSLSSLVEAATASYSSESPEGQGSETSSNHGSGTKVYKKHPKFKAYTSEYQAAAAGAGLGLGVKIGSGAGLGLGGLGAGSGNTGKQKGQAASKKKGETKKLLAKKAFQAASLEQDADEGTASGIFSHLIKNENINGGKQVATDTNGAVSSSELGDLKQFRRARSTTISYSPYAPEDPAFDYNPREGAAHVRTLNWLANLGDDEMAAAHLLSGLSDQVKAATASKAGKVKVSKNIAGSSQSRKKAASESCSSSSAETETQTDTGDSETMPSVSSLKNSNFSDTNQSNHAETHSNTTTTSSSLCSDDEDVQMKLSSFVGAKRPRASTVPELGSLLRACDYAETDEDSGAGSGNVANALRSKLRMTALAVAKELHGSGGSGYVGIYSPEERKLRIERFAAKRHKRVWTKKVKYDVRKNFADSRVRVKGRFIRKEEENVMKDVYPAPQVEAH